MTTLDTDRLAALDHIHLEEGAHDPDDRDNPNPADGACIMEAVAWIAHEPWSDHPECASPVIAAFLRAWNDALDPDPRQSLKAYAARLVGSKGTVEQEEQRAWMALDWLVRTHTPAWLRAAGLTEQATRLEELPEFVAGMDVPSIRPTLDAARKDAAAAAAAAGAAARDAAGAAARDAARAAARDAARAAARDAAGDAARAAARAAARDAARDAARAAARAAARDALAPTVETLQTSAHGLVDQMLAVTEKTP